MTVSPWLVQIYDVSDVTAQGLIVGLLSGLENVVVESSTSGIHQFVIVESPDASQSRSVFNFVMSIDPGAALIHMANGPVEILTR